jgi:hypothetical protein
MSVSAMQSSEKMMNFQKSTEGDHRLAHRVKINGIK